jgi:hypothetical protein
MFKFFKLILLLIIVTFYSSCIREYRVLYSKKSKNTKTVIYKSRWQNFDQELLIEIVSYDKYKKNRGNIYARNNFKGCNFCIYYLGLLSESKTSTDYYNIIKWTGKMNDSIQFVAITDTVKGYYQFDKKINTIQLNPVFIPISVEEKALFDITMQKGETFLKPYKNDLRQIIGWTKDPMFPK